MSMTAGTSAIESGSMAEAIYNAIDTEFGAVSGSQDTDRKKFCAAIASAVVGYISANADVTITTGDGALQQASSVDTTAPTANRTLSAPIS